MNTEDPIPLEILPPPDPLAAALEENRELREIMAEWQNSLSELRAGYVEIVTTAHEELQKLGAQLAKEKQQRIADKLQANAVNRMLQETNTKLRAELHALEGAR